MEATFTASQACPKCGKANSTPSFSMATFAIADKTAPYGIVAVYQCRCGASFTQWVELELLTLECVKTVP